MQTSITMNRSLSDRLQNRIPPPALVLALGFTMTVISLLLPPNAPWPALRLGAGPLLIALGIATVVTGARTFWASGTTIDPVSIRRASTLVTHGIFSLTRNPMYVGFTLMLLGWSAVLSSPWTLAGPVFFVLFTHRFQILPEERVMREKFGAEYTAYCQRVRRWI